MYFLGWFTPIKRKHVRKKGKSSDISYFPFFLKDTLMLAHYSTYFCVVYVYSIFEFISHVNFLMLWRYRKLCWFYSSLSVWSFSAVMKRRWCCRDEEESMLLWWGGVCCCDEERRMLLWWGEEDAVVMRRRVCCWDGEEYAVVIRRGVCCCDKERRMLSWWGGEYAAVMGRSMLLWWGEEDAVVMRRGGPCCIQTYFCVVYVYSIFDIISYVNFGRGWLYPKLYWFCSSLSVCLLIANMVTNMEMREGWCWDQEERMLP